MDLESRIRRLERSNVRWRIVTFGLMLILVASVLVATVSIDDEIVTASRFHLVDSDGRIMAILGLDRNGAPNLVLRDRKSADRAHFGLRFEEAAEGDDGVASMLRLTGATAAEGIQLGAWSDRRALALHDLEGNQQVILSVNQRKSEMSWRDAEGNHLLHIGTSRFGTNRPQDRLRIENPQLVEAPMAGMTLFDEGEPRGMFIVWADGRASFDIWEPDGNIILSAPDVAEE